MTKTELRKKIKAELNANNENFNEWSSSICNKIIQSEVYKNADIVLAYMSLPDEVCLEAVLVHAKKENKKVYIPRIVPGTSQMDFYEYAGKEKTVSGSYGIDEPDQNNKFDIKTYNENILFLIPGRGFSKKGNRLGRGKGFYDLYLSELKKLNDKNLVMAGVCFSLQVVSEIPVEPHDIKMDIVICQNDDY